MKIFKQVVKKIDSMVRSFLLLSMLFLAVGIAYGDYTGNIGDYPSFKDKYENQEGIVVLNVTADITFEGDLKPFDQWFEDSPYPLWTKLTIKRRRRCLEIK